MRCAIIMILALSLLVLAPPGIHPALAHGFGESYDLPLPLWLEVVRLTPITQTLGLFVMPLLFLAAYLSFTKLSQLSGGGGVPLGRLAGAYVYSLVPIAIVHQVAHYYTYYTYLLIPGQAIISYLSDPFGWG